MWSTLYGGVRDGSTPPTPVRVLQARSIVTGAFVDARHALMSVESKTTRTSMPSPDDAWAELEANEVRLFIGEPVVGLWCPTCALPSGWQAPVQRDSTDEPGMWLTGCVEDEGHRLG